MKFTVTWFIRANKHIPIASLSPEIAQNTITLIAPSKTYNVAGLECSFAIIPNRSLRKRFLKSRKGVYPWVNLLGMVAAKAAYQHGDEWLRQVLVYLEGNRDFLVDFVRNNLPDVQMGIPQATYLAWLDCRQSGIEQNPYQFFLEKAQGSSERWRNFRTWRKGFCTAQFRLPRSLLEEALVRMQQALRSGSK